MSLKAKLEAVIYAAEEPVNLAQLAGLFTDEALEWKAERCGSAEAAEKAALPLLNDAFQLSGAGRGRGRERRLFLAEANSEL